MLNLNHNIVFFLKSSVVHVHFVFAVLFVQCSSMRSLFEPVGVVFTQCFGVRKWQFVRVYIAVNSETRLYGISLISFGVNKCYCLILKHLLFSVILDQLELLHTEAMTLLISVHLAYNTIERRQHSCSSGSMVVESMSSVDSHAPESKNLYCSFGMGALKQWLLSSGYNPSIFRQHRVTNLLWMTLWSNAQLCLNLNAGLTPASIVAHLNMIASFALACVNDEHPNHLEYPLAVIPWTLLDVLKHHSLPIAGVMRPFVVSILTLAGILCISDVAYYISLTTCCCVFVCFFVLLFRSVCLPQMSSWR